MTHDQSAVCMWEYENVPVTIILFSRHGLAAKKEREKEKTMTVSEMNSVFSLHLTLRKSNN